MRILARRSSHLCAYCRGDLADAEATRCDGAHCTASYHAECWRECAEHHHSCAILGCGATSATARPRRKRKPDTTARDFFIAFTLIVVGVPTLMVLVLAAFLIALALPPDLKPLGELLLLAAFAIFTAVVMAIARRFGVQLTPRGPSLDERRALGVSLWRKFWRLDRTKGPSREG